MPFSSPTITRDRAGSLLFGRFLGKELQARGLQYTPHYTLPLMGHRRRELVDAKAGVYRYDQLIVLRATHMPAVLLEAGSIVNRQEELQLASPERRDAHQRGDRCRRGGFLRGARQASRGEGRRAAQARQFEPTTAIAGYAGAVWLCRNASALMIMKLRMLTPSPVAKAGA